jgi:tryptophan synthase alpha chain
MSRIDKLFSIKKQAVLNIYFTAGFPSLEDTLVVMKAVQKAGADMIELGMPYSDPLADGPVIQSSSARALQNGMTIHKLFEQLRNFRKEIHLPVLLMGYLNPILQYGFENFCRDAALAGVDGLIVPDLPVFEFENEYGILVKKYKLDFVFLVTPETPAQRIRKLDDQSSGFLYAVSSSATTGKNAELKDQEIYFGRLHSMNLTNPILIGFGIKDKRTFTDACSFANGAIVGTAFIRVLENASSNEIEQLANDFITLLR